MKLTPLHDPADGPMRVVGLMSGSGTNIRKILERQRELEAREGRAPFEFVVLFSDRADSRAVWIGKEHDLPVVVRDLAGFCARHGVSRWDLQAREAFDRETVSALSSFGAKVAVYGGYMSITTPPLIEAFLGVNVHPADLSIQNPEGGRKFVGAHGVGDAIASGEKTISSSTNLVELQVDQGPILMISAPVEVVLDRGWDLSDPEDLQKAERFNQDRLKEKGDWVIFPRTVEDMARGKYARDGRGRLYYEGEPIPQGWRLI